MTVPTYVECVLPHSDWFTKANAKHQQKPEFLSVQAAYQAFRQSLNIADTAGLNDTSMITAYVNALNIYKDIIDQLQYKTAFNAQTKFHSNIMEEFWCLLFSEQLFRSGYVPAAPGKVLFLGCGSALQSAFFAPHSFAALLGSQGINDPWFQVRHKDRDFLIARRATVKLTIDGTEVRERTKGGSYKPLSENPSLLPIVTIECKQYLDKTMLDNAMAAADHRRLTTPSCLDLVAVELNKLSDWNIGGSGLDNLYLLRKQRLTDATFLAGTGPIDTVDVTRRNPIDVTVVTLIYNTVKSHLNTPYWRASEAEFLQSGVALGA